MTTVLFLIRSLDAGGAERQLVELVKGLDKRRFRACVTTFYPGGALEGEVRELEGVELRSLEKKGRWRNAGFLARWLGTVRGSEASILCGYMGIANELCLLAGRTFGRRVVYGIRSSDVDHFEYGALQGWAYRIDAATSRFADRIIVNSRSGLAHARSMGYAEDRMTVIPNGVDTDRFRPLPGARRLLRQEWGLAGDAVLVGIVGRLDRVKGHEGFLRAAADVLRAAPETRFVAVGDGTPERRSALERLAEELGLGTSLRWEHGRPDTPAVYSALDALCLTSRSEGFPNVVAEAMACEIPCVVTDVGDAAWIVGETGAVVPGDDVEGLAKAIIRMAVDPARAQRGRLARNRVVENFSARTMVSNTEEVFSSVADGRRPG